VSWKLLFIISKLKELGHYVKKLISHLQIKSNWKSLDITETSNNGL